MLSVSLGLHFSRVLMIDKFIDHLDRDLDLFPVVVINKLQKQLKLFCLQFQVIGHHCGEAKVAGMSSSSAHHIHSQEQRVMHAC